VEKKQSVTRGNVKVERRRDWRWKEERGKKIFGR